MRPALRLLLAAAAAAPATNEDACAAVLREEGLDARACAALESRGLLPRRALAAATHAPHPHEEHHEEHHEPETHVYEHSDDAYSVQVMGALVALALVVAV